MTAASPGRNVRYVTGRGRSFSSISACWRRIEKARITYSGVPSRHDAACASSAMSTLDAAPSDRRKIETLFDSLPHTGRGKRKVPFERRISSEESDKQRGKLVRTLVNEQAAAEREYALAKNSFAREELEDRIARMQEAQYILDMLPSNIPLPATWHGLLGMRDKV